jgi:uncharacterized protein
MIFVDTSAWFALYSLRDVNHAAAVNAAKSFRDSLITSDFIIDETLTLLRARGENARAIAFGQRAIHGGWCEMVRIDTADFAAAWKVFNLYADKNWSFTDCTSWAVIQRLSIRQAFAFDDHFRQFGNVAVVP